MSRLRPFFSYYGSKWRLAPCYPIPKYKTIVEPFAGSACYSLVHHTKDVHLVDKNPVVCGIWDYLIKVKESEIESLPLLASGESIPDSLVKEARDLLGFWVSKGVASPRQTMTTGVNRGHWSASIRARISSQLKYIRHWQVSQGSYSALENQAVTWFVDPPYVDGGEHYPAGSSGIDFPALGAWCKSRQGQTIVCENQGATWLPFTEFKRTKGMRKQTTEVVWVGGVR